MSHIGDNLTNRQFSFKICLHPHARSTYWTLRKYNDPLTNSKKTPKTKTMKSEHVSQTPMQRNTCQTYFIQSVTRSKTPSSYNSV